MAVAKTYPIILAHGIARFDVLSNLLFRTDNDDADDAVHYFKGIRTHLRDRGFDVWHTNVSWAGSLKQRAADLKAGVSRILQERNAPKVHIIGHSMGGLDARRMLFDNRGEDLHEKVASLSTVGTPHHGSPFADFVLERGFDPEILGLNLNGVRDLATGAANAFNDEVGGWEKDCGVRFRSYAGAQEGRYIFTPLKISFSVIEKEEGPNDGLVSLRSAQWAPEYFSGVVLDADHLNQVGWWDPAELLRLGLKERMEKKIRQFYLDVATDLANQFPVETQNSASA